MLKIKCFRLKN